jgi:Uma2 family endonuclease
MTSFTVNLRSITHLDDTQFEKLCIDNRELKLELTPNGELVIVSPTGGDTGRANATLITRFVNWNEKYKLGEVFDSSTCFKLPNGGTRSPDVSWIEKSRWAALSKEDKRKFPPIAPDFVLELLSPSDSLRTSQEKMQEYMLSGVKLGWLINPEDKQVEIYRVNAATKELLQAPDRLSDEYLLPGFDLTLTQFWE